jgi:type II secretory pathway pseudopilin PulG
MQKFSFNKKAAMFGLDARIALAIFAVLSVISGSVLYSVLKQVKAAKLNAYFTALQDASDAYYLDNGQQLPQYNTGNGIWATDLVDNRQNLDTWKGPYVDFIKVGSAPFFTFVPEYFTGWGGAFSFFKISKWAGPWEWCNFGATNCAEWYRGHLTTAEQRASAKEAFDLLDDYVDNGDGPLTGKVRFYEQDANNHHFLYMLSSRRKPPDD